VKAITTTENALAVLNAHRVKLVYSEWSSTSRNGYHEVCMDVLPKPGGGGHGHQQSSWWTIGSTKHSRTASYVDFL